MDAVRWGIIGCGDVTEVKSGAGLQKATGSQLVAVMRRDGAKAADYAARHGVPRWVDDADALIHDPKVNAVYIATPPDSHADYTVRVAQAGKPVYVEKPMARTVAECEGMIDACRRAQVPLFVAYYRRMLPTFRKVQEIVSSGVIGDVRFVNIALYQAKHPVDPNVQSWRVVREIAGGGYFYDLASHQFDYLDYLLGPVAEAKGNVANQTGQYEVEDIVTASFRFQSGVLGAGIWCFTVDPAQYRDEIEIVGSRGKVSLGAFQLEKPVVLEVGKQREEFHLPPPAHVQQPLIQTIVDELLGRGTCPSTGESAARTNWVMEQIVDG